MSYGMAFDMTWFRLHNITPIIAQIDRRRVFVILCCQNDNGCQAYLYEATEISVSMELAAKEAYQFCRWKTAQGLHWS